MARTLAGAPKIKMWIRPPDAPVSPLKRWLRFVPVAALAAGDGAGATVSRAEPNLALSKLAKVKAAVLKLDRAHLADAGAALAELKLCVGV